LRAQDQEAKVEISSKPNQVSAGDQRKFDYFFYEGLNLGRIDRQTMVKGIISGIEFSGCLQVQPFVEEVIEFIKN